MNQNLEKILPKVQKPSRYTGGEYNAVVKDKEKVALRYALCFPDTYEIGMSNLGCRILYGVINQVPDLWCERVYAPWGDMEDELRGASIPLYALESGDPLTQFDMIGFSLGYELAYTNVLNVLDLAGIPYKASERDQHHPLIVAGGTCTYNPEPLADFIDLFIIGEGEDVTLEYIDLYRKSQSEGWSRAQYLKEVAKIEGVYVPTLYDIEYNPPQEGYGLGTISSITPKEGAKPVIKKRIVQNMDTSYFPTETIIPSTEIVHDRVILELFRGCIRGCRFCQAGYAYRPVRTRNAQLLGELGKAACEHSGYQEMTLSSLSSTDYPELLTLCDDLLDYAEPRDINLSLPSLRADSFSMNLMERMQRVRKGGLTFAPEAGTQRLRDSINKNLTEEDLLRSCQTAFAGGWSTVKLYFMLGLPTETDEDVRAIAELARKIYHVWREYSPLRSRGMKMTISTSCFVPKAHTAYQWEGQIPMEEYLRRVSILRDEIRREKSMSYNWHDPETSFIEAIFARGDRRLGAVIEEAWKQGAKFDAWSEYFSLEKWTSACETCHIDPTFYANRDRTKGEIFPWSITSTGVTEDYLWRERELAHADTTTPDCDSHCSQCGANRLLKKGEMLDGRSPCIRKG
ncbi:MAG: TIGR03960 family B12-binding radical SAM protein [Eubacteriales bacterium]